MFIFLTLKIKIFFILAVNLCNKVKCLNNGLCKIHENKSAYCECSNEYFGDYCDHCKFKI